MALLKGPFVKKSYAELVGKPLVSTHSCASLVQFYTNVGPTVKWREGIVVKGNKDKISPGTAIATFVNGAYPNLQSGNHAALYVDQDELGITVIEQWIGLAKIHKRHIIFRGEPRKSDGFYPNASNNGDAFSVIMTL